MMFAIPFVLVALLIAAGLVAAIVRIILHRRPAPGACAALLRSQAPLLLGTHLLILTAILFGTRLAANATYANVGPSTTSKMMTQGYSEWTIDFWIGPFVVCTCLLALIILLTTLISDRSAQWRGDIILFTGLVIASGIFVFVMSQRFETIGSQRYTVTSENVVAPVSVSERFDGMHDWKYGWFVDGFPVLLLIASGLLVLNLPALRNGQPRLSRMAAWGVPMLIFSPPGVPIATSIFGFIAIVQIKRSRGKLYGLRLAAVEALLFPWMLILAVTWAITAALIILVAKLLGYSLERRAGSPGNSIDLSQHLSVGFLPAMAIGIPALLVAMIVTFFAGRAMWRVIVGRPVRTTPVAPPRHPSNDAMEPAATSGAGPLPQSQGQTPPHEPSHFQLQAMPQRYRWWIIAASMAVYAVAFFLPVTYMSVHRPGFDAEGLSMSGANIFRLALTSGDVVWFGNPLLWLGWVLLAFRRRYIAALVGIAVGAFALSELRIFQPHSAFIMQSGYYCWATGCLIFSIGAIVVAVEYHRATKRTAAGNELVEATENPGVSR